MRAALAVTAVWLLAACAPQDARTPAGQDAEPSRHARGQAVYEQVCASCHASGGGDAPVTGDPATWSNRSPLWEAVLYQHANKGYLSMPAKGGAAGLTQEQVEAAAEFMLNLTFTDRPPDPG